MRGVARGLGLVSVWALMIAVSWSVVILSTVLVWIVGTWLLGLVGVL